jgi:hypothetical protein
MAAIPKRVIERFQTEVRRFQRILKSAINRDVNEADTVVIVGDILSAVLGFDKYTEVTSEFAIRSTYCDLAIRVDGDTKYLVEAKAIGLDLKEHHLRQAVNYGANQGVLWVVLTNGVMWEVYRILFEKPIGFELVYSFNFLELNPRKEEDQRSLFLLCKEGLAKSAIEEYHEHHRHVNPIVLGAIIQSEEVTKVISRVLRRISPGLRIKKSEIDGLLINDVLKRGVLEGEDSKKAASLIKRAAARTVRK